MKDYNYLAWAKRLNPVFILVYGIFCFYLAGLAQYGGVRRRLPIIIVTFTALVIWLGFNLYKHYTKSATGVIYPDSTEIKRKIKVHKYWFFTAILTVVLMTGVTGYNIYQSAIPYNGKLSWYVGDYFTKKEVPFVQNNIFDDGLDGMINALENEVTLPDELYISDAFNLTYDVDGEITKLDGFLYGMNEVGETNSFLMSFDAAKSDNIELNLDGYVDASYDPHKKFQPLLDGVKVIDLTFSTVFSDINTQNLFYDGFREIARNDAITLYYDEMGEGHTPSHNRQVLDFRGYTFTLYTEHLSINYVFYEEEVIQQQIAEIEEKEAQEADPNYFDDDLISEEFFLTDQQGYQLVILDAALGSRFYGLRETTDGGENWLLTSTDPFQGRTGSSAGLAFIRPELGFAVLARGGGSQATLFRTTDGGQNFNPIEIISPTVTQNDFGYDPFDFPNVPYEEDGTLYLEVGQGADGDYNGGIHALYESYDDGETFTFVEELTE